MCSLVKSKTKQHNDEHPNLMVHWLGLASAICISGEANGEIRGRSNYLLVTLSCWGLQHQNTHPMTLTDQLQVAEMIWSNFCFSKCWLLNFEKMHQSEQNHRQHVGEAVADIDESAEEDQCPIRWRRSVSDPLQLTTLMDPSNAELFGSTVDVDCCRSILLTLIHDPLRVCLPPTTIFATSSSCLLN